MRFWYVIISLVVKWTIDGYTIVVCKSLNANKVTEVVFFYVLRFNHTKNIKVSYYNRMNLTRILWNKKFFFKNGKVLSSSFGKNEVVKCDFSLPKHNSENVFWLVCVIVCDNSYTSCAKPSQKAR